MADMEIIEIVGSGFHKGAKKALLLMRDGHPLMLNPRPDHPKDPNAIEVRVSASSLSERQRESIRAEGGELHPRSFSYMLGYIPAVEAKRIGDLIKTKPNFDVTLEKNRACIIWRDT